MLRESWASGLTVFQLILGYTLLQPLLRFESAGFTTNGCLESIPLIENNRADPNSVRLVYGDCEGLAHGCYPPRLVSRAFCFVCDISNRASWFVEELSCSVCLILIQPPALSTFLDHLIFSSH